MLTGYQIPMIQSPQVDIYLHLVVQSSKQTCIARSTMEFEFIALDKAGEEAKWLRQFLEDIPM